MKKYTLYLHAADPYREANIKHKTAKKQFRSLKQLLIYLDKKLDARRTRNRPWAYYQIFDNHGSILFGQFNRWDKDWRSGKWCITN